MINQIETEEEFMGRIYCKLDGSVLVWPSKAAKEDLNSKRELVEFWDYQTFINYLTYLREHGNT